MVSDALTAELQDGKIKPGDKLPTESELMTAFGVSRMVVREALSRLQAAGKIETHHGVGSFALVPSERSTLRFGRVFEEAGDVAVSMLELRAGVECEAAALAATRRQRVHLDAMQAALDEFDEQVLLDGGTVGADFRFHFAVAEATGNPFYRDLMAGVGIAGIPRALAANSDLTEMRRTRDRLDVAREHRDIFAAIARGDFETARAAMRTHLWHSRERATCTALASAAPAPLR